MTQIDLSVVIPVYRSEAILPDLVGRLVPVLDRTGLRYEVVFVDDDSPDGAWRVLVGLRTEHPGTIVALRLMRNFGQHNALMCGFRHCRGRLIVTMDDDLQHPPEDVPRLIDAIEGGDLNLVYGVFETKKHDAWRNLGSTAVRWFYRAVFRNDVPITSFRVMKRPLLESIFTYNLNFTYIDGLLAWNTRRIGRVTVGHHARAVGRSGYSVAKLVGLGLNMFTNFSLLPLHFVSFLGVFVAGCGLMVAFGYLVLYLTRQIVVPGYASTIIAVLVLGGVQLLSLGIMGEYLGRLHLNVNRKPQYTLRESLTPEPDRTEPHRTGAPAP